LATNAYRKLQLNVEEIEVKNIEIGLLMLTFVMILRRSKLHIPHICGHFVAAATMWHMQHISAAYLAKFCIFSHTFSLKKSRIF